MLLGSTSPSLSASQAQMYLRAQMLIFTPAATVATVQSDIPLISSSAPSTSTQPSATQFYLRKKIFMHKMVHFERCAKILKKGPFYFDVQNLTLRNPPILEISCPQNSPPKINNHDQSLAMCHKTTVTSSKTIHTDSYEASRKGESPGSESRCTAVTRTASLHQLLAPGKF
ncbi:unnamed protein product [Ranitomeya imitator]|uniref:Uncharacterized protein n=1 Tax=Ranitomeya imitator TaxID=111125 RepID=A0ABN9KSW9_9NEOB|nr:unnamed protein product [Ranitomeya imitator]